MLTLDLRYYDTNLSRSECNAFTSAQNASFSPGNITAQNPNGLGTNWCSATFIAKLSASIDFNSNLKLKLSAKVAIGYGRKRQRFRPFYFAVHARNGAAR